MQLGRQSVAQSHTLVGMTSTWSLMPSTSSDGRFIIVLWSQRDLSRLPASFIPITSGGNSSYFHGVPDWVYEEEVFASDFALWWSPDGRRIAYLSFDETDVDKFDFPIYNPTQDSDEVHPYPEWVSMRYPKVRCVNPKMSFCSQ